VGNVLIVSEDTRTAELAALICRSAGHGITIVDNGLQALMVLDERPMDVILADVGAARFCAHALSRLVRSAVDARPQIVAMVDRDQPARGLGYLGITAVVTKPLQPDALRQAMMTAFGRSTWVEVKQPDAARLDLE
jgi:DNA-binding response OmpR family regulator